MSVRKNVRLHEKTVQSVARKNLPRAKKKQARAKTARHLHVVIESVEANEPRATALRLAGGDNRRLVVVNEKIILVANNHQQARKWIRIKKGK